MRRISNFIIGFLIIFAFIIHAEGADQKSAPSVFRIHQPMEPTSLDPQKQKSGSSNYLLGNLYRNIFRYDDDLGLIPDLGEKCLRTQKALICKLKKGLIWSDGSALTAADFIRTYQKILNPTQAVPRADLLFHIKNAQQIYSKKKTSQSLGITAPDPWTLKFEFDEQDSEFEYNLANFILAPTKADLNVVTGPYKVKEWKKGQKLVLEPNFKYPNAHASRPNIEYLFVAEDSVALELYQKNQLDFLRRLPTIFIPTYRDKKDFHWLPVLRLDYIGFGPELENQEDLRKNFIYSLNYSELQRIFHSEGRPGCVGLPLSWFPEKTPCYDFDLKKVSKLNIKGSYLLVYSTLGGEDHRRAAEWMQDQWSKNAELKVNLQGTENKIFLIQLENHPPALFRKGVSPDKPTCLSSLETFRGDNPENYLRLKSLEFEKILNLLAQTTDDRGRKKLCQRGVEFLMNKHLMIPLGSIHFAVLAKTTFSGWKINKMNQLELSQLHPSL